VTTAATVTNALTQSISQTFDPERGLVTSSTDANGVITTTHYDGLGRTIAIWGQSRATSTPANELYTYTYGTATTPTVVTAQSLNDAGGYVTSTTLYDALLRVRQTQAPTPQGGRLINDTFYDTHGWTVKTNSNYYDSTTTPDETIETVADDLSTDQTQNAYNGAGQVVQTVNLDDSQVKSTTYAVYYGDTTVTIPGVNSSGVVTGTPTATVTDALGRTTALEQYATAPTVTSTTSAGITTVTETGGTPQTTSYTFNNVGQQTQIQAPGPAGT
jgi:YD repeat-containing protein